MSRAFLSRHKNPKDFGSFRKFRGIKSFEILVALGRQSRGNKILEFLGEALVECLLNEGKYQSHVRVRVWVRFCSCLGQCPASRLVRIRVVSGFVPGSCLVCVRFVSVSCLVRIWIRVWVRDSYPSSVSVRIWFVSGSDLFRVWVRTQLRLYNNGDSCRLVCYAP